MAYTLIATQTLAAAQSDITFSNIPQTYKDLVLEYVGTTSSGEGLALQFNGDTGTNYSFTYLAGTGTAGGSGRSINQSYGTGGNIETTISTSITNFLSYSNTTTYKTTIARSNGVASGYAICYVATWRSTNAITSIKVLLTSSTTTYSAGNTFKLWGIS